MMATFLGILNVVAVCVVLLVGLFSAVNSMGRTTQHGIRIAWILMTLGAAGVLLGNLPWASAVLHGGLAFHVVFDQRRRRPNHDIERPLFHDLPHIGDK